jgi:SAM-dependent methyltransferase
MRLEAHITQQQVSAVWNKKIGGKKLLWSHLPLVIRHAAKLLGHSYKPNSKIVDPWLYLIAQLGPYNKAVSVGCGLAVNERKLLRRRVVKHFNLFDLAEDRLAVAATALEEAGLQASARLSAEDAFDKAPIEEYDLVFWKSSLHHMMSAHHAVEWSWRALRPGGVFAMWEFVGPTRFQWSDRNLEYVNEFRSTLPVELFRRSDGKLAPREISRPSIKSMLKSDPSEAADSSNIVPSVKAFFPEAHIAELGAAMCHIGFRNILDNLTTHPSAESIVRQFIIIDSL